MLETHERIGLEVGRESVVSGDPSRPGLIQLVQLLGLTRAEERRKIDQLRRKAEQLALDAEVNASRMLLIAESFHAD